MGDGVGSHQQFEAGQARQEVALDVVLPQALAPLETVAHEAHRLGQEGARAGGGVEYLYAVERAVDALAVVGGAAVDGLRLDDLAADARGVGQSLRQAEVAVQQVVDGAHDEAHDGLRRVPYALGLALSGVVGGEEVLIEVDHGVVASSGAPVVGQEAAQVDGAEGGGQVVDEPGDAVVEVVARDALEETAQEGVGLRDERGGLLAGEGVGRVVVQAGGKHAVDERLGVEVGKLGRLDVVDKGVAEGAEQAVELAAGVVLAVVVESAAHGLGQQAGLGGHGVGQASGRRQELRPAAREARQEGVEGRLGVAAGQDASLAGVADAHLSNGLAALVEVEIQIVSEDDVGERAAVAVELLAVLAAAVEVGVVDVLGLDEGHGQAVRAAREDEVGRAAGDACRFVGDGQCGQAVL